MKPNRLVSAPFSRLLNSTIICCIFLIVGIPLFSSLQQVYLPQARVGVPLTSTLGGGGTQWNVSRVVVLFANRRKIAEALQTVQMLRGPGQWQGVVVLVGGHDWSIASLSSDEQEQIKKQNVSTQHFPEFNVSRLVEIHSRHPVKGADDRLTQKTFQWHKIHIFNVWFKQWNAVLYIDVGCKIEAPVEPFFHLDWQGRLLGHSDAYPFYEWKLHLQFDLESRPDIAGKLEGVCPFIRERDYFQTGLLLFDTNVAINTTTVDDIWELALAFPISKTNEQGIMNILFNCKLGLWRQIDVSYVDHFNRRHALYDSFRDVATIAGSNAAY